MKTRKTDQGHFSGGVVAALLLLLIAIFALSAVVSAQAPLWASRDRLLDRYVERKGMVDRCEVWNSMNPVSRGVFLTTTHNMWQQYLVRADERYATNAENSCEPMGTDCTGRCMAACTNEHVCADPGACIPMGGYLCWQNKQCDLQTLPREGYWASKLIDHVDKVYAVLDGGDPNGVGECGGENNNRIFFSLDSTGIFALRNITMGYLPGLKTSGDLGGPHEPFDGSRDTEHGQPRPQWHYFLRDDDGKSKCLAGRRGVGDVCNPWVVEMDIDYNNPWHDSNPLCTYTGDLGMEDYRSVWGEGHRPDPWWPVEYEYAPGDCTGYRISEIIDAETRTFKISPNRVAVIKGSGFAAEGNKVFFVRDALTSAGSVEPISQSGSEIRVRTPELMGDLYVYLVDGVGRHSNTARISVSPWSNVVSVNSASYEGSEVAAESIVAAFGSGLATGTESASSKPLPTTLAGTTVNVKDSKGGERLAPLFYVSPTQINYQMPQGTSNGTASVTVRSGDGNLSAGTVEIATVGPGLYSASGDGQGYPAGMALRAKADGSQAYEPIARFDVTLNRVVALPIDLGPAADQVFLVLYGTGIRHYDYPIMCRIGGVSAEVPYAGQLADFVGLDQMNIRIPRELAGRGEVDVQLIVNGKEANRVRVIVK